MSAPSGAATARGADLAAFLLVGGSRVALPARLVEEAIVLPDALGPPLPGVPAMVGTFVRGALACPLIDLARCLGLREAEGDRPRTAVLLRGGGRRTAVLVDRVEGVGPLPPESVARLSGGRGVSLAALPGHERPVIVIGADDLPSFDGMVFADAPEAGPAPREGAGPDAAAGRRDLAVLSFSRGGATYGVPLEQVHEIVIDLDLEVLALPVPGLIGRIRTRRGDAMLIDRPAPGCGEPAGAKAPSHAILLRSGGMLFAVPADAIHAISRLAPGEAVPLPGAAGEVRRLVTGLAPAPPGGGPVTIIDAAAVLDVPEVRALVEEHASGQAEATDGATGAAGGPLRAFIELQAGGRFFVALDDVRELATLDRSSVVLSRARTGIDGIARHRGEALAVIDLAARLRDGGGDPAPTADKLVIVATDDGAVGFVVEAFAAIEHLHLTEASMGRGSASDDGTGWHRPAYERHWQVAQATSRRGDQAVAVLGLLGIAREATGVEPSGRARPHEERRAS